MLEAFASTIMTPSPITSRQFSLPVQTPLPAPHSHYPHHTASPPVLDTKEPLHFCFCVPFKTIPGPERDDILFATEGAEERWLHQQESPLTQPHKLPVHQKNLDNLRKLCKEIQERENCRASLTVSEPKAMKRKKRGAVMNVSLAGDADAVYRMRGYILQSLPVSLVSVH